MHQLFVLSSFFLFLLAHQYIKYTAYLHYVVNLNYWETNTLFIFLFFGFFTKLPLRVIFIFLINLTFTNIFFFSLGIQKKLLTSLIVGTVILHPLGFYIFTILFSLKFYFITIHHFLLKTSVNLSALIFFLSVTLFLGSLWASQSNSWGYFWVNDAVEWLLLLTIIYTLVFLHLWVKPLSYNFFLPIFIIVNFLILVRLNFVPTRHSFIATSSTLYFLLFFYIFFFNLCMSIVFFVKKSYNLPILYFCAMVIILIEPLFSLKFFFIFLFFYFLSNRLNQFILAPVLHLICMVFLIIWLIFFKFFFLNYYREIFGNVSDICVYFSSLNSNFNLFKLSQSYALLEFVDFFISWNASFSNLTVGSFNLSVCLNNWVLFHFFILVLTMVKSVEFRFLYKKKTLV